MAVRPPSLRARLAATALMVSTLTSVVLVIGVQALLTRSNDASVTSRLTARSAAAAATVVVRDGQVHVLEQSATTLDQNVWIYDTDGNLVEGNPPTGSLGDEVVALSDSTTQQRVTSDDVSLLARPVVREGEQVATVVTAADLEPYERAEQHSLWLSMLLGLVTVVVATLAAWVAAGRSLRQVQAMADLADEWREHDPSGRFDPGPGGDEIAHLGRTLDRMLDRIGDALAAERRLTDEIAHELRTPLAVVLAEADLARRSATPDQREELDSIYAAALRMRDSIGTMLTVARAHAGTGDRATVGELMTSLGLDATPYDAEVMATPVAPVVAAVRPLLDNAVTHGSGTPRVEVTREGRTIVIAVVDDGPGVPADDLETVFTPGHTTSAEGSGLGLALARRMARAVGGDLVACPGPGGRFEVRVPAR